MRSPKKNLWKMTSFFNNAFPPEVVVFVSKRSDDFSLKADQNDLTESQKQFLSAQLGFTLNTAVNIRQVHGGEVVIISKIDKYVPSGVLKEADGILTDSVDLPILIRSADCVPIFIYDSDQRRIGLFHAGWKGTQKKILINGLKLMRVQPESVKIAFGPAIRKCCYEISGDVLEYFSDDVVVRQEKYYLDLVEENIKQAVDYGIKKENITDCKTCTCCDQSYFSHRREGDSAGRMISLMMLKKDK